MNLRLLLTLTASFLAVSFTATAQVKKPINAVPFTITKPGNYYLAKDLVVTKPHPKYGFVGILVGANNVTIDLNGRELSTASGTGVGIDSTIGLTNVTVRNGLIRGFGIGISLGDKGHALIEEVRVVKCSVIGIWLTMDHATVRRCVVRDIGGKGTSGIVQGIRVDRDFAVIEDCTVAGFTRDQASLAVTGIFVDSSARVCRNTVLSALGAAALTTGIHGAAYNEFDGNYIDSFASGMEIQIGAYRNNSTNNCTTKYTGGTSGGGNL
jgi:hypothetical protein